MECDIPCMSHFKGVKYYNKIKYRDDVDMKKWSLLGKLTILAYCITMYIEKSDLSFYKLQMYIIFVLIYVIINTVLSMVKIKTARRILIAVSILFTVVFSFAVYNFLIILVPINLYEMIEEKLNDILLVIILMILSIYAVFIIMPHIAALYAFIALFSFFYYKVVYYSSSKIDRLTRENDNLRSKNYRLTVNIDDAKDFSEQVVYTTKLEERNKISQEMHDKLGHCISASTMQLEAAQIIMDKDEEKAKKMIQNSIENLRDGMNQVRGILRNLKPSSNEIGINKIKFILDKFKSTHGIDMNFVYSGDIDKVDYGIWSIIYDNTREALTNILKYSDATKVIMKIEVLNKMIKVEIRDNGKGSEKIVKGLGITGIEERVESIGGKVIIDGENGFSIITLFKI